MDARARGASLVGDVCASSVARDLRSSEAEVEAAARDAVRMQSELDNLAPEIAELDTWRRRFATRVDAATMSEGVMAASTPPHAASLMTQ